MKSKSIISALIVMFTFSAIAAPAASALEPVNRSENSRQNVLVSFHEQPGASGRQLVRSLGGRINGIYNNFPVIAAELPEQAITALSNNPRVRTVETDYETYAVGYTATEEVANSWGVGHIGADSTIADGHTGSGVKVAVIDSGADYTHPDLAPNFDLGNLGYDAVSKDNDPMDGYGHGTHVSGSVAAAADSFGVVGVAADVQLFALRVLDDNGYGSTSTVLGALDWLVDYNASNPSDPIRVTNNSYGSRGSTSAERAAFDQLAASGVLHVAAAGNSGNPGGNNDTVIYPAKYGSVMAVAAIDSNNSRPNWSSTGPDVEITAPGVSVLSTWNGSTSYANPQPISFTDSDGVTRYYKEGSGTSMSSPHVAGVAALAWGIDTNLTNENVRTMLRGTAEDIGLSTNEQGHGLVRADMLVAAAIGAEPAPTGTVSGTVTDNEGAPITGATVTVTDYSLSASTDSEGNYSLTDVPAGEQELSASADGFQDMTVTVTVTEDTAVTQDFSLTAQEPGTDSINANINYQSRGGRTSDKHLDITVTLEDSQGGKIEGATISITLVNNDTGGTWGFTETTGSNGSVTHSLNNAPGGCYTTTIDSVSGGGSGWDGTTPANEFCK